MTDFLKNHYRYFTCNSWNRATSYANNMKLYRLDIPDEFYHSAYEMLDMAEFQVAVGILIDSWEASHDFKWQVGQNGRMGGYLVLYRGTLRPTEYKSVCTKCGQRNYTKVLELPGDMSKSVAHLHKLIISHLFWTDEVIMTNYREQIKESGLSDDEIKDIIRKYKAEERTGTRYTLDNKCGRCGELSRVNYETPPMERITSAEGVDQNESFEDWSLSELRERVRLVQSFDRLCDQIVAQLVYFLRNYKVGQETVMVPKTIKVLKSAV